MRISNDDLYNLVHDERLEGKIAGWVLVYSDYEGSGRHTEYHYNIYRTPEGKFYRADYETSVKESMDWAECNWEDWYDLEEVETVETIITKYITKKKERDENSSGKQEGSQNPEQVKGRVEEVEGREGNDSHPSS